MRPLPSRLSLHPLTQSLSSSFALRGRIPTSACSHQAARCPEHFPGGRAGSCGDARGPLDPADGCCWVFPDRVKPEFPEGLPRPLCALGTTSPPPVLTPSPHRGQVRTRGADHTSALPSRDGGFSTFRLQSQIPTFPGADTPATPEPGTSGARSRVGGSSGEGTQRLSSKVPSLSSPYPRAGETAPLARAHVRPPGLRRQSPHRTPAGPSPTPHPPLPGPPPYRPPGQTAAWTPAAATASRTPGPGGTGPPRRRAGPRELHHPQCPAPAHAAWPRTCKGVSARERDGVGGTSRSAGGAVPLLRGPAAI